jgi:hypothetical protein
MGFPYPGGFLEISKGVFFALIGGYFVINILQIVSYIRLKKQPPTIDDLKTPVEGEQLEAPCQVSITRGKSMIGAINNVQVNLNEYKIGVLKNGGHLQFKTFLKENTITVVDEASLASKSIGFEAEPGGNVQITYNYPKGKLTVENSTESI